jgi:methyl-accepting chemotaxis protein
MGYIGIKNRNSALESAKELSDSYAKRYSNQVKAYLESELKSTQTLAEVFEYQNISAKDDVFGESKGVIKHIYNKRPDYHSLWMSWEKYAIDKDWDKDYGRQRINYHTSYGKLIEQIDTLDLYGEDVNGLYYSIKKGKNPVITNPYFDNYDGKRLMVSSIAYPATVKGRFIGLAGIDFSLQKFQDLIKNIRPFENSNAFLVSNDGLFVANQKEELLGENIEDWLANQSGIIDKIQKGKAFSMDYEDGNGEFYISFAPIQVEGTNSPWMAGIAVPKEEIYAESYALLMVSVFVGFIGLIFLTIVIVIISKTITKPLTKVTEELQLLSEGNIKNAEYLEINTNDEVADIADSTNKLIKSLDDTSKFATQIGMGNLDAEYDSLGENDTLGKALLEMRSSLKKAKIEEEKRRRLEEKQQWATSGFAKFGDILRYNTENMKTFAENIISNLVEYTDSNQGAIYLINNEDEHNQFIEMMACYAYERKKFVDKQIQFGEGLIGQCVLEKKPIFMTEIPDDYINITSGLGDANPKSLLIVPLKFNDEIYGVVELASFNVYDEHERKFVEDISENIASTVSSVKVNIKTKKLLEESKLKSEELAAQEEEMRQNMEELQTTQEESARREQEMNGILNALNEAYLVGELDKEGNFISVNKKALQTFGITKEMAIGNNIRNFLQNEELDQFDKIWETVMSGKTYRQEAYLKRSVGTVLITETYSPIFNENDEIYKVLNIAVEIKNNK